MEEEAEGGVTLGRVFCLVLALAILAPIGKGLHFHFTRVHPYRIQVTNTLQPCKVRLLLNDVELEQRDIPWRKGQQLQIETGTWTAQALFPEGWQDVEVSVNRTIEEPDPDSKAFEIEVSIKASREFVMLLVDYRQTKVKQISVGKVTVPVGPRVRLPLGSRETDLLVDGKRLGSLKASTQPDQEGVLLLDVLGGRAYRYKEMVYTRSLTGAKTPVVKRFAGGRLYSVPKVPRYFLRKGAPTKIMMPAKSNTALITELIEVPRR